MVNSVVDSERIGRLISRMCDAGREEGCSLVEVAQAARCVCACALAQVSDDAAALLESLSEDAG